MKKLLAMLLSLVMVFALVSFTSADDADFTLVIKGGDVNENTTADGLKVDLFLNGTVEDTLLTLTFALTYDPAQVTFVKMEKDDAFNMAFVNDKEAGKLRFTLTTEGIAVAEETAVASLYFTVADELEAGTEIAFALDEGAVAETYHDNASVVTPHEIAADFAPFIVSDTVLFKGIVKFNEGEVQYKGATAYVIWDCEARVHTPAFTVYEEDGETVISPENYDFEYKENTLPGTGYLFVYFKGAYSGEARLTFKIYLPATTATTIENVADGIKLTWEPVEDAAGYVIYRRAWSSTTNGWTAFARWDNTTETTYLDGHDASHPTYAGTRYQYGVKAYFARRTDPVANAEIGGNVNNDSGNFNLGEVGPLKTTVRITTRKLTSVTPGTKQMTIKWEATKNFTGIQVQYAPNSTFTGKNSKNYKIEFTVDENGNVVSPVVSQDIIKDLTSGKTYYVRIRSYCLFEGMNYYGEWSNVLNGKIK